VIGGGPAGASFALRMARLGHRVILLERSAFPRPHVGEVLTPGIWPLLDALGTAGAVRSAPFLPVAEARVRWAGRAALRIPAPAGACGLTVDRGRFDLLLLEAARSAGAQVWQPALASRPRWTATGWEVSVTTPTGVRQVSARFLADGSGRSRTLRAIRARRSVPTLALHGRWRAEDADDQATRLEAGARGWFWRAHLPDGSLRAFAFVDREILRPLRPGRAGLERLYRELLASTELLHDLRDPRLEGPVEVCDATCYFDPSPITAAAIRLGDASCAIDPLSSSGVQKALQSALAGSAAVHTLLRPDGDAQAALDFYRESQRHAFEVHADWAGAHYREEQAHAGEPFWRRRRRTAVAALPPRRPVRLEEALPHRARLAPGAALVTVACLVGDGVERRRALSHPGLRRPVAFLEDVELAPLIDGVTEEATLAAAVRRWAQRIPPARALSVGAWLCQEGLLEIHQ